VRRDRLSQIGSAVAAEVAAVSDFGPELRGRVGLAARLAEGDWMIQAQLEEQRPESDKEHHDARIVVRQNEPVKGRRVNSSVEDVDSGG
jgi:hypothetical protein